jgi:hypothetical protein
MREDMAREPDGEDRIAWYLKMYRHRTGGKKMERKDNVVSLPNGPVPSWSDRAQAEWRYAPELAIWDIACICHDDYIRRQREDPACQYHNVVAYLMDRDSIEMDVLGGLLADRNDRPDD